ncbi:acyl-CoA thioesterase [Billgrantia gudaonensis]|uniref:Acyl-CoA thioesterase FadM n=1 Tax=Billgrantia gudaonensis TaxID=376427 RepID=A0A1G8U5Q0_9GAMM|nr:thioesterase family protein [Halomonas gudaonensis]SDJ49088.1 Acyl-CoA thioesterase FadM [Halomonas gudaonensis]
MERIRLDFPDEAIIHRHTLAVRITDMNYGRHLGHDALVSLLHEARVAALASLGLVEWDLGGCASVVADLAVQYQAEARWPDALMAETAVRPPEGKALTVYQRLRHADDDRLVATARLNLVLLDPANGRPAAVPASVRDALVQAGAA